jgi:serine/threonine-protein kinase ATR
MNNLLPSTPFSVPGLNTADSNPGFLRFVRSLIDDHLSNEPPRIPSSYKGAWAGAIDGLTNILLGPFPLPDSASWTLIGERILILDAVLEVILRVFLRVEEIYTNSERLIRKVFARLLDLCWVLEVWTEVEVDCGGELFSPIHMKDKAFGTLITLLRGLDDSPVHSEQQEPSWNILRSILKEVLDVSSGRFPSLIGTIPYTDTRKISLRLMPPLRTLPSSRFSASRG